jgi:hypothetical protein
MKQRKLQIHHHPTVPNVNNNIVSPPASIAATITTHIIWNNTDVQPPSFPSPPSASPSPSPLAHLPYLTNRTPTQQKIFHSRQVVTRPKKKGERNTQKKEKASKNPKRLRACVRFRYVPPPKPKPNN